MLRYCYMPHQVLWYSFVSLLTLLPDEFTREDVSNLRIAQGMKPDPSGMINQWVSRGRVVRDDLRGVFAKKKIINDSYK